MSFPQKINKYIFHKVRGFINSYKTLLIIISGVLLILIALLNLPRTSDFNTELFEVTHVADGDTITVKDSKGKESTLRYIGMDTPESVKPNTPVQCFAIEASNYNKQLVLGKKVKLESDVEDKDKYGRILRYVYIDQNNDGKYEEMVNEILLNEGYARLLTIPPDVKYVDKFKYDEKIARENNKGLWAKCNDNTRITNTQSVFGESTSQSVGFIEHKEGCDIKGNISTNGDKIYHIPGQKYYNTTQIEPNKGERWFCTEQDAQDGGFRKSKV